MAVRALEIAVSEVLNDAKLSGWEAAVGKMENFLSDVRRVTVTYGGRAGLRETTSLVVKCETNSATVIDLDKTVFFETEIKIYKLLQLLERTLFEKGQDLILWPKFVGFTRDPYQIAMEDLKLLGYDMRDKKKGLDLEHCLLAVESLGKFHALSSLLPKNEVKTLSSYSSYHMSTSIVKYETKFGLGTLAEVILELWGSEWTDIGVWIQTAKDDLMDDLRKLYTFTKGKFDVMNHGDCWSNNILFRYDKEKPVHARFIDFQLCFTNCFAWDLTNLLYLSTQPAVRLENYNDILRIYQESYKNTLARIGNKISVPSLAQVEELMDWTLTAAFLTSSVGFMEISFFTGDFSEFCKENMSKFFQKQWYIDAEDDLKKDIAFFKSRGLFDNKFKLP